MINLGPFRKAFRDKQDQFGKRLRQDRGTPLELAVDRKTLELMQADLDKGQSAFQAIVKPDPLYPATPAARWAVNTELHAEQLLIPHYRDSAAFDRQVQRFKQFANDLRKRVEESYKVIHDTKRATQLWVIHRNIPTKAVIGKIADALESYVEDHPFDEDILRVWPVDAVWRLLSDDDRPDLGVMLRLALDLPNIIDVYTIREKDNVDSSLLQIGELVVSTVIYSIPVIGTAVAAFEIWRGKDIFNNDLSDFDRGVLGASVFLPLAGRMIKGGKALYTAERAARLYGEDAREWSYAMAMGERVSADAAGLNRLKSASEKLAEREAIGRAAAEDLGQTFRKLGLDSNARALVPSTIRSEVVALFESLSSKYSRLKNLDAAAMERLLAKGTFEGHVKGQLFEELLEEKVVKLLRDPYGRAALGIDPRVTGDLYFIPGHLIRDEFGLQLTDGMIIRRIKKGLHVVAVFEAKSGEASARGLAAKWEKVTAKQLPELRAEAEESIRELQERARINQLPPPTTTVDEQMKRIIQTQQGGQIRSDVERLSELKVWINGTEVPLELYSGPRSTRWLGVLPTDVNPTAIREAVVKDAKIENFDIIGVEGITSGELTSMAQEIIKRAKAAGIK